MLHRGGCRDHSAERQQRRPNSLPGLADRLCLAPHHRNVRRTTRSRQLSSNGATRARHCKYRGLARAPRRDPHRAADPGGATTAAADHARSPMATSCSRCRAGAPSRTRRRLVPAKFEDAVRCPVHGQRPRPMETWFGTSSRTSFRAPPEVVAAAIERTETRGVDVVFHCHDRSPSKCRRIVARRRVPGDPAELPSWAAGLRSVARCIQDRIVSRTSGAGGRTAGCSRSRRGGSRPGNRQLHRRHPRRSRSDRRPHSGRARGRRGLRCQRRITRAADRARQPAADLRQQGQLPVPRRVEPSCAIYPDHFFCYGCGERGSQRLTDARRGQTTAEAVAYVRDWPGPKPGAARLVLLIDNDRNQKARPRRARRGRWRRRPHGRAARAVGTTSTTWF